MMYPEDMDPVVPYGTLCSFVAAPVSVCVCVCLCVCVCVGRFMIRPNIPKFTTNRYYYMVPDLRLGWFI